MAVERDSWRGRKPANLTDVELEEAIVFAQTSYDELKEWAPIAIWSFFNGMLADLTVEKVRRLNNGK